MFNVNQVRMLMEKAYKDALQHAYDEGWSYLPDELEQSVRAGNAAERIMLQEVGVR